MVVGISQKQREAAPQLKSSSLDNSFWKPSHGSCLRSRVFQWVSVTCFRTGWSLWTWLWFSTFQSSSHMARWHACVPPTSRWKVFADQPRLASALGGSKTSVLRMPPQWSGLLQVREMCSEGESGRPPTLRGCGPEGGDAAGPGLDGELHSQLLYFYWWGRQERSRWVSDSPCESGQGGTWLLESYPSPSPSSSAREPTRWEQGAILPSVWLLYFTHRGERLGVSEIRLWSGLTLILHTF